MLLECAIIRFVEYLLKNIEMLELKVDKEKCIGCGTCEAMEPGVFKLDEEMKSEIVGDVKNYTKEQLMEMARMCPMRAIEVWEDGVKVVE